MSSVVLTKAEELAVHLGKEVEGAVLKALEGGRTHPAELAIVILRAGEAGLAGYSTEELANIANTAGEPV